MSALEEAVLDGADIILTGEVSRIEEKSKVTAVFLKSTAASVPERSEGVISEPLVIVYIRQGYTEQQLKNGNRVKIIGEAQRFETARNPGNFDQRSYYQRQGIHVLVWADQAEILSGRTAPVCQYLSEIRSAWKEMLTRHLGEYYGGTMSAVLLGEKSSLDAGMKKMYQKNGIGHLLAISGLHMSFIGMGIYSLLRKAGLGFIPAGLLGGSVLIFYTLMIGAGVSSLRALIMFLIRVGADMAGRDYDLLTSLCAAAAVLVGKQPLYLTDAGFQLSFGAILGIFLLDPVFRKLFQCTGEESGKGKKAKVRRVFIWAVEGISVSLAVNVTLLGPMLYFYFEVPPYSVFLNLLVIPLMPVAMGAGILGSFLVLFSESAGGGVLQICRGILWGYDRICTVAGRLPGSRMVTGRPDIAWLIAYYAVLAALCVLFYVLLSRKDRMPEGNGEDNCRNHLATLKIPGGCILIFTVIMTALCKTGHGKEGELQVTVLDVGQGDGIHIKDGKINCLIDGGSSDVTQVGTYRIEPYLLSNGVSCLDYVFLTHGDEDHISGVREILEGQSLGIRIQNLVLPPEEYQDEKLKEIARTAYRNGTRVAVMEAGNIIAHKMMKLTCIGPEPEMGIEPGNGASLVLELSFGAFDMLLTGDLEGEGEEALIKSGRLKSYDVLKAAHHGSKSSGSEEFLEIVHPSAALISAGVNNRYGHPHKETLERLGLAGCEVWTTQKCGAVRVWSDGKKMRIGVTGQP